MTDQTPMACEEQGSDSASRSGEGPIASPPERAAATCPHCDGELKLETIMHASAGQTITYKLTPLPGSLMSTHEIGSQMRAIGRLLEMCAAEESGLKLKTWVAGIDMDADGAISFTLLMAPVVVDDQGRTVSHPATGTTDLSDGTGGDPSPLRPAPSEPSSDPSLIAEIRGLRKAVELFVRYDENDDADGTQIMLDYDAAISAARDALKAAGTTDPVGDLLSHSEYVAAQSEEQPK